MHVSSESIWHVPSLELLDEVFCFEGDGCFIRFIALTDWGLVVRDSRISTKMQA